MDILFYVKYPNQVWKEWYFLWIGATSTPATPTNTSIMQTKTKIEKKHPKTIIFAKIWKISKKSFLCCFFLGLYICNEVL